MKVVAQICASDTDVREHLIQSLFTFALGICILLRKNEVESYIHARKFILSVLAGIFLFFGEAIKEVTPKQIGIKLFEQKFRSLLTSEYYEEVTQLSPTTLEEPEDTFLDSEFTRLFCYFHDMITGELKKV